MLRVFRLGDQALHPESPTTCPRARWWSTENQAETARQGPSPPGSTPLVHRSVARAAALENYRSYPMSAEAWTICRLPHERRPWPISWPSAKRLEENQAATHSCILCSVEGLPMVACGAGDTQRLPDPWADLQTRQRSSRQHLCPDEGEPFSWLLLGAWACTSQHQAACTDLYQTGGSGD